VKEVFIEPARMPGWYRAQASATQQALEAA